MRCNSVHLLAIEIPLTRIRLIKTSQQIEESWAIYQVRTLTPARFVPDGVINNLEDSVRRLSHSSNLATSDDRAAFRRKVIENVGLSPDEYQGFAFGMGIDRIAMLKYGISDVRKLFEPDMRWISHYGFSIFDTPSLISGLSR